MAIFISGATGYIGQKLAIKLAEDGNIVHALVRRKQKGIALLSHPNIRLFEGDILDTGSLLIAMNRCSEVYHLAALASVWHPKPSMFRAINVNGLKAVLDCCVQLGIRKVLFTSTAGVIGHSMNGQPVAEFSNSSPKLETYYERSKEEAEHVLKSYLVKGVNGVIVNPSRVYGPGLLTESNGFTRLLSMYIGGKWKVVPGTGTSIGNYAYIDDVVTGIMLAMQNAKAGERYLLGGVNASYNEFFALADKLTGITRTRYHVPQWALLLLSRIALVKARLLGKQPLITPPFVRKYSKHWIVSSEKAKNELGYSITPFEEGLKNTITWLSQQP